MLLRYRRTGIRLLVPMLWILGTLPVITILASVMQNSALVASTRSTSTSSGTPIFRSLSTLVLDARCRQSCFDGLEPGLTTLVTLKAYWKRLGVAPNMPDVYRSDENNAVYSWTIEDIPPFITAGKLNNEVSATVYDAVVDQVIVPITPCVSEVTVEFGEPGSVLVNEDQETYYLLYPELGLAFYVSAVDSSFSGRVNAVFFISKLSFPAFMKRPESERLVNWSVVSSRLTAGCKPVSTLRP